MAPPPSNWIDICRDIFTRSHGCGYLRLSLEPCNPETQSSFFGIFAHFALLTKLTAHFAC